MQIAIAALLVGLVIGAHGSRWPAWFAAEGDFTHYGNGGRTRELLEEGSGGARTACGPLTKQLLDKVAKENTVVRRGKCS